VRSGAFQHHHALQQRSSLAGHAAGVRNNVVPLGVKQRRHLPSMRRYDRAPCACSERFTQFQDVRKRGRINHEGRPSGACKQRFRQPGHGLHI
jgi:hypothetical protein